MSSNGTTTKLRNGLCLGAWELRRHIFTGGQGEVWEVRPNDIRRSPSRSMKICLADDPGSRVRFNQEVELLRVLNHPGVIPILDSGFDISIGSSGPPCWFYVTERFDSSLAEMPWLHEAPILSIRLFRQLLLPSLR